jgi:hypothetical protein
MHYAKTASKLREQIIQFSGELSFNWGKVARRFLTEAIYGIQARQSVRLTEIARALGEKIPIKKTQYRLCRQLGREDLGPRVMDTVCRMGASSVEKKTLLVLDISDITKKYARKMEYMARVRDGSQKCLGNGYWTLSVIATDVGKPPLVPLYNHLYSHKSPDYESENTEIRRAIRRVIKHTRKRGVWVLDRGGDRGKVFAEMIKQDLSFIIRLKKTRDLVYRRREHLVEELAALCPMIHAERIVRQEGGKETIYELEFGALPVQLPGKDIPLTLVVVRGLGQEPMALLTSLRVTRGRKSLWWVISAYLTRWRIEETIRFIKQSYQVEDIRLLTYTRLQNMMAILLAVAYFAMVYLGLRIKLRVLAGHVLKAARRLFGVPDFRFYALADGIRELLFGRQNSLERINPLLHPHKHQLSLFDP